MDIGYSLSANRREQTMKNQKRIRFAAILAAVLTAVILTASAVSDSTLGTIYDAGRQLLFNTSNVTLSGTAEFSLDGARFKTVNAKYVQDGVNSAWDYKLLTPRADGTGDRESGYTVYANSMSVYTVDRFYPGTYRVGFMDEQNTLVRRSALMDQTVELAGTAIKYLEPLLPEGAVQVIAENHTGSTVRVMLDKSSISDLVDAAFNLCAQMAVRRAIEPVDFDQEPTTYIDFDDYITPAKAIIGCTERYQLNSLDVTATLDGNGQLRALSGAMSVALELDPDFNIAADAQSHVIDVTFDVKASDYGQSKLELFDPEAAGLKPQWTLFENEEWEIEE